MFFFVGQIKIWNLQAALNPRSHPSSLCIQTLNEHKDRVFHVEFDQFQVVSSSYDDTILCFNFLPCQSPDFALTDSSYRLDAIQTQTHSSIASSVTTKPTNNQNVDDASQAENSLPPRKESSESSSSSSNLEN